MNSFVRLAAMAAPVWLGLFVAESLAANTIDEALEQSQRTGRPIFAMAGAANCGPCQALLRRLNTDPTVLPLVAQFVPLKIDTQTPEWQTWAEKYPPEGNAIPMIFVIRANGEKLYCKSGALDGPALPTLMTSMLGQCGAVLSDKQLGQIDAAVTGANKLLADGAVDKAVAALVPWLSSGSYAAVALEADKLAKKFTDEAQQRLSVAEVKLAGESDKFDGALELIELNRLYARLPELTRPLREALKKFRREASTRDLVKQAELVDKAKVFEQKPLAKRAMAAYEAIAAQYPDTPAAKFATDKIAELEQAGVARSAGSSDVAVKAAAAESSGGASASANSEDQRKATSYLAMAKNLVDKRPERAREYLEKVIGLAPASDLAREAEELLGGLK